MKRDSFYLVRVLQKGLLVFLLLGFYGCASAPKTFDAVNQGPQVIFEPDTIRLGVAAVMGTDIVCRGKGFQSGERIFVKIIGIEEQNQEEEIGLCSSDADEQGSFLARVESSNKVFSILKAVPEPTKKGLALRIVNPPIPEGVYDVVVEGLSSGQKAKSSVVVTGPSFTDKIKDWLGARMGKIIKE